MSFVAVSWVGRGMGVKIVEGKGQFWGKCGASNGHLGVVILCREGWRRGSLQITMGFLVLDVIFGRMLEGEGTNKNMI